MKGLLLLAVIGFAGLGLLSGVGRGQTPGFAHRRLMIVVEKGLPGATIFDSDTDTPICDTHVGIMSPHEAAFSLDGRVAYIPIYGSTNEGVAGINEHAIDFFSTADCSKLATLDTGNYLRPHGVWVGESGTLYVTSEIAQSVLIVDPAQHKIIGTIPTGSEWTHMLAVMPDEKVAFTSNVRSKTISVLDITNRKIARTIATSSNNHRMTLSPDHKWFVTSLEEGKVLFFRTSDYALDFSVNVDGWAFVGKFGAEGFYYEMGSGSPRDSKSWGTGPMRVWKIDPAGRRVVATSTEDLGAGTGSLEINPFNHRMYVSAMNDNQVDVLDPTTLKLLKRIPTKETPDCIEFTSVR